MNPFDFVNSITTTKQNLMEDPQCEKEYNPFLVNRALSYFPDTVMYANACNQFQHLDKKWQYDFLRTSISKKKRYSKWHKKQPVSEDLFAVQQYYKYSTERALELLNILSEEEIKQIKQLMDKGGRL